jgi:LAO/AO transport system kinase
VDDLFQGIVQGRRSLIGRALTLVESAHPGDRQQAQELLQRLLPRTGSGYRIGVSGSPGVGKSTFIEKLGLLLLKKGHGVAVLAVDPSSQVTGGSILGDKTRMPRLGTHERAFVRPSPSGGTLGGVARRSRESMMVLEAAGYDVVLVETVGVGQSESTVAEMVDSFLLLLQAGAGDELQGIKRGVLELADVVAVTKADGSNLEAALQAREQYSNALHVLRSDAFWQPPVLAVSGLEGRGLAELWQALKDHRRALQKHGRLEKKRQEQLLRWAWSLVEEELLDSLRSHSRVGAVLSRVEEDIIEGRCTPAQGARTLLEAFGLPNQSQEQTR